MSKKNSSDSIGNRTRNLPACSTVPQPTAPRVLNNNNNNNNNNNTGYLQWQAVLDTTTNRGALQLTVLRRPKEAARLSFDTK
jgi:hypothetical protein